MKEFTIRALILGVLLAVVLGVANTYLGLYAGMTVSASIPAAVISMAILRGLLRSGTIQENNIVQSIASAGESLAAGVIFTVPAIVLIGAWQDFEFWPTTFIAGAGGVLGIIFMVPLRYTLLNDMPNLVYPEGQACSKVLEAGQDRGPGIKAIFLAALVGVGYKLLASISGLMKGGMEVAGRVSDRVLLYFGSDYSPALMGMGFIVRLEIAAMLFLGGLISSGIYLPITAYLDMPGFLDQDGNMRSSLDVAGQLWSERVRYLGIGAMLVGGVFSLFEVLYGMRGSFGRLISGSRLSRRNSVNIPGGGTPPQQGGTAPHQGGTPPSSVSAGSRADMSIWSLLGIFFLALLGTFYLYESLIDDLGITLIVMLILIPATFLFVAVAAYIVGLVGSSNSPVSGMTICVLLLTAGVLLALGVKSDSLPLAILGVAGIVCCATATAGDIAQDLKTGQLVGATPFKQQWGEILGILVTAPIFAFVLQTLHENQGIGSGDLKAPQAGMFASLTTGVLDGDLPYNLVGLGMGLGVLLLLIDQFLLKRRVFKTSFRLYLMPVAVGLYLPMSVTTPIFIGGLLRYIVDRHKRDADSGVLFGSGLIAGEALAGVAIAMLGGAALQLGLTDMTRMLIGLAVFGLIIWIYYRFTHQNGARITINP